MAADGLGQLRAAVFADPGLQDRLLATVDRPGFVAATVELAAELGIAVEAGDVEDALVTARRDWFSTWI